MEYDDSDINSSEVASSEPFNPYEFEDLEYYISLHLFVQRYIVSLTKLILCIFVVANGSLLIYAIRRFKNLQTKTNYILLNVVVSHLLFSILSTTVSLISALFPPFRYLYATEYVVLISIGYLLLQFVFLFTLLLALDWLISAKFKNILSRYQKYYKWIIAGVYLLCLLINGIPVMCNIDARNCAEFITNITYLLCFLTLIVINIIKYRKIYTPESLKTVYALYVANIFCVIYLPLFVMTVIYFVLIVHNVLVKISLSVILVIVTYLLEFVAYVAPIISYVMLLKHDKNFKMSFDYIFKLSVRNYVPSDDNNVNDDLIP